MKSITSLRRRARVVLLAGGLCAAAVLTPIASAPVTFDGGHLVDGPNRGVAHELGDFNEDGVPDVLTSSDNGTVTLMLGRGDGWFDIAPGSPISVGGNNQNLVVADFNGDAHLDAAIVSITTGRVYVVIGDGLGGLAVNATSYLTGNGPFDIATADVDGDSFVDLVVVNEANGGGTPSVSVLRGDGTGAFSAAGFYAFAGGSLPRGVAVGDITGDAVPDIVVVLTNANVVQILVGGGGGTFSIGDSYPTTAGPRKVVLADFDGNGSLDIATADSGDGVPFDPANSNNKTTVLLNDGFGAF